MKLMKKMKISNKIFLFSFIFLMNLNCHLPDNKKIIATSFIAGLISGNLPFACGMKIHEYTNYKPYIYTPMFAVYLSSLLISKKLAKQNINEIILNISSLISAYLTCYYLEEYDNRTKKIEAGKPSLPPLFLMHK